jgi:hypothetical protein
LILGSFACESLPNEPLYNNPIDPLAPVYRVNPIAFGPIEATRNRQVTLRFIGVDPYAEVIFLERRNGPVETFAPIATISASERTFTEILPPSQYLDYYYRARVRAIGGALSPYSMSSTVYFSP